MRGFFDKLKSVTSGFGSISYDLAGDRDADVTRLDILVADEPTGNLDPVNTWEVINLLLKINELGATVILATHDNNIVNNLERRVVLMDRGRIIKDDEKGKYLV